MRSLTISSTFVALLSIAQPAVSMYSNSSSFPLSENPQSLLDESMAWMDTFWDPSVGYLRAVLADAALHHDTRSSAWYAVGLLARNQGEDVANAERIIRNVIGAQFKNVADQWYGDYQTEPEQPLVGSPVYPEDIYNSWDPNWRGFIGTTFVLIIEEFESLLSKDTVQLIESSLYNNTRGDSYRVGGVDDDNLYPCYSNPSIMRALVSGWTGRRFNDSNMTTAGENYAQEIIDLFRINDTLSEFNSATYTGVSLYGLTMWSKYLPSDSIMSQNGASMVADIWETLGALYHPQLRNVAGPWDRTYGFDMQRYFSIIVLNIWTLVGKEYTGLPDIVPTMSHADDFTFAPLIAVLSGYHNSLVPESVKANLQNFSGEHTWSGVAYSPPWDNEHRNMTTWLAPNISIGAQSFNASVIGGASEDSTSYTPAVVQWQSTHELGFIKYYPTENAMSAVVKPYHLSLAYPSANSSSIFTYLVATFWDQPTVSKWEDLVGLSVNITGNVNMTYSVEYAGAHGGADTVIHDFEYWNFTYTIPEGLMEMPFISLDMALP